MKQRKWFFVVSLVIVATMLLAACGSATPTAEPTTAAPGGFVSPTSLVAPDCNYGSAENPAKLKAIEALDDNTVKFTLCAPDPAFPSKVAFSVFSIADSAFLDANNGDSVKMSENPNGTGPYTIVKWNRGDSVVFKAFDNYWGEKAKIPNLIFRWSEQSAARLLELQAGTANGVDNPAPEDIATIKNDPKLALFDRTALNIFYIGFNNSMAPFDKVEVRQRSPLPSTVNASWISTIPLVQLWLRTSFPIRSCLASARTSSGMTLIRQKPRNCWLRLATPKPIL